MTRTETNSPATDRLSKRRLHRRLMFGFIGGGVAIGLLLREVLGYPLLGEVVYWVGIIGFLAVWIGSPVTLFDERDTALERRASKLTLELCAVVLALGASTARVLTYTDTISVPSEIWAVLWGYVALFVTFAVIYSWLRYRP